MDKSKKGFFLPRERGAYWTFAAAKLLITLMLVLYGIFIVIWTLQSMAFFKARIIKLSEDNPEGGVKSASETIAYILSSRQRQLLQTHRHFFLFTGLFLSGSAVIGLYGVLKELVTLIYICMSLQSLSIVFEYVGALHSNDENVLHLKLVSLTLQPVLIILLGLYALMIRKLEEKQSSQLTYRQTVVGMPPPMMGSNYNKKPAGHVNMGLNLDDEPSA